MVDKEKFNKGIAKIELVWKKIKYRYLKIKVFKKKFNKGVTKIKFV